MSYRVEFSGQTIERLKRMDQQTAKIVLRWVEGYLEDCEDPRRHGKGLAGRRGGIWRYRIGRYRLVAEIRDEEQRVLLVWLGAGNGLMDEEGDEWS